MENILHKKYLDIFIYKRNSKFIVSTPMNIFFLNKPLIVRKQKGGKNYIFKENNTIYKISSLSLKNEIKMQLLARKSKVNIPEIKWWGMFKKFMIIAMEFISGVKIINKPYLYNRIKEMDNELIRHNIFHNDWNRGNVLYDEIKDKLWLLDFGEATSRQVKFTNPTNFLV